MEIHWLLKEKRTSDHFLTKDLLLLPRKRRKKRIILHQLQPLYQYLSHLIHYFAELFPKDLTCCYLRILLLLLLLMLKEEAIDQIAESFAVLTLVLLNELWLPLLRC